MSAYSGVPGTRCEIRASSGEGGELCLVCTVVVFAFVCNQFVSVLYFFVRCAARVVSWLTIVAGAAAVHPALK